MGALAREPTVARRSDGGGGGRRSRRRKEEGTLGAVVPAAGLSRRMGREKVLLPFGFSTLLETVLSKLRAAGVARIVVVVRPDLAQAATRARAAGADVVVNPLPEGEMLESIRLGVAVLPTEVEAFFVWPADHPAVRASTVDLLAARAARGRAVLPVFEGRRGHPALVGADLRAVDPAPRGVVPDRHGRVVLG